VVVVNGFPKCLKCQVGDLVPLSDFGSQGAAIHFKAWACTNPTCGFNIKIRNGDLYIGAHQQRRFPHPSRSLDEQPAFVCAANLRTWQGIS